MLVAMFSKSGGEAKFPWREGKTFVGQVTFLDNLPKESIYFSCFDLSSIISNFVHAKGQLHRKGVKCGCGETFHKISRYL